MFIIITALFLVFTAITILSTVRAVKASKALKQEPEAVAVGRNITNAKIWLAISAVWILLSVVNIFGCTSELKKINSGYYDSAYRINTDSTADTQELRGDLSRKQKVRIYMFSLLLVCSGVTLALAADEIKNGKFSYIAKSGVYFPGGFLPAEEFSCEIKESTLYLYRKKRKGTIIYTVVNDRERLTRLLEENYELYYK